MFVSSLALLIILAPMVNCRYIMYLTGSVSSIILFNLIYSRYHRQHNVVPDKSLVSEITHVALAFMSSATFNQVNPSSWPLFTTVETARLQFHDGTAIMVAIGGWGDTAGFEVAAATPVSRKLFAHNVRLMVDATGADGKQHGVNLDRVINFMQVLTLTGNTQGW